MRYLLIALLSLASLTARAGERLYNGFVLPDQWPPRAGRLAREPMPVPYLKDRPAVVPIDVGRQLLVDDFLIELTTLKRTFHHAEFYPKPMICPEKPWETEGKATMAYAYSGGAWFDPRDKLFRLWYSAGLVLPGVDGYGTSFLCLATSKDGIQWDRPSLDVVRPGSNIVLHVHHDSTTVWLDHQERDPARRFKEFDSERRNKRWHLVMRTSPDGIHWTETAASPLCGDRTTVFYNPFRNVWVVSQRIFPRGVGRARGYVEAATPEAAVAKVRPAEYDLPSGEAVPWVCADRLDPHNPDPRWSKMEPQLYNLDAAPYESLMLGLFAIWQGPENGDVRRLGIQKRNDLLLGFSRDGFHWHRPDRERFIAGTGKETDWNYGNVQSAGGGCLVVGDKLYFYVSARPVDPSGWHGRSNTGLAILRRDGFASLDAGSEGGTLTTRPLTFRGKHLFVNVAAPKGELRAEVLDVDGKVVAPFTEGNCNPITGDATLRQVTWKAAADLSSVTGKPVRLRFRLANGSLYAFWVSPDASGASHGYVAAGGPGLSGSLDTVGAQGGSSNRAMEPPQR